MIRPISNSTPNGAHSSSPSPWHPIERSIGAGLITRVFSDTTPTPTGLMYGGISGGVNYALLKIKDKTDGKAGSTAAKAGFNLFDSTVSWGGSAGIMNVAFRVSGKPIFRMNPALAIGTAVGVELASFAIREELTD
jgi:hypothetical protein